MPRTLSAQYSLTGSHCVLADQFIACGKSNDIAHELASQIWLAVLDSLEENENTFFLLKSFAQEGDVSYTIQKFVSFCDILVATKPF